MVFLTRANVNSGSKNPKKKGFKQATIRLGAEQVQKDEIRNNATVIIDDPQLAELLWNRIKDVLPEEFKSIEEEEMVAVGISDHFRFYRYEEGQKFVRHFDGYEYGSMVYTQNADKKPQPKMTFLVYLNDSFEGGKTTFFNTKGTEILAVEPTTGNALVYTQKLLHEGSVVTGGRKYVLRSDILFGKPSPQQEGWSCLVQ
eukprot:TRINITY_DN11676_c0_g1_i1.p1 TRINITY_DN11676_c0_g1~~TRINITY_DN11676_c0_g1_i1.p1  ORF type:complete len:200 (-),score=61.11 TRINITY_DN11676_c0_g1_i1:8-607(-)